MTYHFDFYSPKIGGGVLLPGICPKISKTLKFGLFWGIFACSGLVVQTVLHTSVPAYRGFLTEIALFLGFCCPKIGMGGGFLPPEVSPKPSKTLEFG